MPSTEGGRVAEGCPSGRGRHAGPRTAATASATPPVGAPPPAHRPPLPGTAAAAGLARELGGQIGEGVRLLTGQLVALPLVPDAGQHRNGIAAATRPGVKRVVYTSLRHADRSPLDLALAGTSLPEVAAREPAIRTYSARMATAGSTLVARNSGPAQAANDASSIDTAARMNVSVSMLFTP